MNADFPCDCGIPLQVRNSRDHQRDRTLGKVPNTHIVFIDSISVEHLSAFVALPFDSHLCSLLPPDSTLRPKLVLHHRIVHQRINKLTSSAASFTGKIHAYLPPPF